MQLPHLTLILGGASSGKSEYAEMLVLNSGKRPVYLATATPGDQEMADRIAVHRSRRGENWRLVEAPLGADLVISRCAADEVLLFECATFWLLNQVSGTGAPPTALDELLSALHNSPCPTIVVSNEISLGVVPQDSVTREFLNLHGMVNRLLANLADTVLFVTAGLPMALKGQIPQ